VCFPSCNDRFGLVDVERARRSPTYFEELGERRWFLLERMTSRSRAVRELGRRCLRETNSGRPGHSAGSLTTGKHIVRI